MDVKDKIETGKKIKKIEEVSFIKGILAGVSLCNDLLVGHGLKIKAPTASEIIKKYRK